jgi:hypothetical protein
VSKFAKTDPYLQNLFRGRNIFQKPSMKNISDFRCELRLVIFLSVIEIIFQRTTSISL